MAASPVEAEEVAAVVHGRSTADSDVHFVTDFVFSSQVS